MQITVEWSDRSRIVDLDNDHDIVESVLNCALDHYYDRTYDGIPDYMPQNIRNVLAPVLAQCLTKLEPEWEYKTVWPSDEQRDSMRLTLLEALRRQP